ncbi:deoxynucleoside triphosphate triphosphohydrolase SAMHD1-like [Physella acuta]|uniref:deoxynucleoside triphosphate triphosphohydrolase SAMHD1-like n=1 Tax=Physella acuta TaxID=109671 RepID=UPI0027DD7296|nr:deoxynucleoside triphosphate triphosphohydrolase SAMHD1-like [Physella acuta]
MANNENGESDIIMEHFTDPVHGHMSIHPVCVAIINTPQFQRLRYLKQLGTCYYVNTGSAHNRFEHSIGVCFLAGEFAETLQRNQPSLKINRKDILCVQIAGLCRGLGNGPFSHMFEDTLMPENLEIPWDVKQTSRKIFEDITENKEVKKIFDTYGLDENDIFFIKQMIFKKPADGAMTTGRENGKEFLEEIILNGIAAHTFDFLARDCFHLGIENTFNYKRYMNLARVINVSGKNRICMEIEEVRNCIDVYTTRYTLTKYAYRHRVNIATQIMIAELMLKVKDDFKINVEGKTYTVIESTNNMRAFMELDDNILFKILDMDDDTPKVKEAKALVERILKRDLYKCVWESPPLERACIRKAYVISGGDSTESQGFEVETLNVKSSKAITKQIIEKGGSMEGALTEDDFILKVTSFDLGLQEKNPLINMKFYSKYDPNTAVSIDKIEASRILKGAGGSEAFVRIYMRDTNEEKQKKIIAACKHWLKEIQVVKEITRQIARYKRDHNNTQLEEMDFIVKLSDSTLENLERLEEKGILYSECVLIKTDNKPNTVLSIKEGAKDLLTIDIFLINDTKRDAIVDATTSWLKAKKESYEELQKSGTVSNSTENNSDTSSKRSESKELKLKTASSKVFNDSLHGHIKINEVCLKIINTQQFQRLRYIKQAGMLYFLYPGANHNRFEHSLGMYYLAGKFARKLQKRLVKDKKDNVRGLSKAEITDKDILCLEIAGLCYNLDQGPFSKLYSDSFLPKVNREQKHGKRSGEMFQHILDTLNKEKLNKDKLNQDNVYQDKLDQKKIDIDKLNLEEYGLSPDDIVFIKELIGIVKPTGSTRWPYKGRKEKQSFLYEVRIEFSKLLI